MLFTEFKYLQLFKSCSRNKRKFFNGRPSKCFAKEVAEKMKISEFKASNGWFERLLKRNDINLKTISGESSAVDEEVVENWKTNLKQHMKVFDFRDIFNFDETGVFYKLLPNKSYILKGNDHFGGKELKQVNNRFVLFDDLR